MYFLSYREVVRPKELARRVRVISGYATDVDTSATSSSSSSSSSSISRYQHPRYIRCITEYAFRFRRYEEEELGHFPAIAKVSTTSSTSNSCSSSTYW